jgi:hypothetical protein
METSLVTPRYQADHVKVLAKAKILAEVEVVAEVKVMAELNVVAESSPIYSMISQAGVNLV